MLKLYKRTITRAFTLVESLVGISIISGIASVGYVGFIQIQASSKAVKLDQDIAVVNNALRVYEAHGGSINVNESPHNIIGKLKTIASADSFKEIIGLRESMIDRRLEIVMQNDLDAKSKQPRALWKANKKKFIIARGGPKGIKAFTISDIVEACELHYSEDQNLLDVDPVEIAEVNPLNPNTSPEELIKWVLFRAVSGRGSDLHVEKYYNTARFRARIDGSLKTIHSCSEEQLPRFIALFKNFSNMGHQHQNLQDARFGMKIGRKRIDVRVSAMPCRKENQKLTMRFLDKQDGIKELSELHLSERQSGIVNSTMTRDQGLVLVTGPTGSGKTTTLYAFINSINQDDVNIHTIEDPIEYEIEGINQTQTDEFHGIDFATGLRALLRADPDVILVGESRDEETATAAINAALTGHLVLTTLHANDSLRAVSRLISMGVEPYLLGDALAMS